MRRTLIISLSLVTGLALVPAASVSAGPPATLADVQALGDLDGRGSGVVEVPFGVDYLGMSWTHGAPPAVRLRVDGRWTSWARVDAADGPRSPTGRTFSDLLTGHKADAYQLRGRARDARAVAINATDGPRRRQAGLRQARASAATQPPVISRAEWGADESLRFKEDGSLKSPPSWHPTQKLIVHHTATDNSLEPAATVRAIYRYHTVDQGWADIGYNFLVDAQGRIYKGRYSGPAGTRAQDTPTGENAAGEGVTGAHVAGANAGTMGVAMLGTYMTQTPTAAARNALVDHLAWEADRHGLDPRATSTYTNPSSGSARVMPNITGHRDWASTSCPGDALYAQLPGIREEVAARQAPQPGPAEPQEPAEPPGDTTPPSTPEGLQAQLAKGIQVRLSWTGSHDEGGSGLAGYEVLRATAAGGPFTLHGTAAEPAYDDRAVQRKQSYWYRVVAVDGTGNRSGESNTARVRIP
jgi:uncharacterized protein with LGFP repeats